MTEEQFRKMCDVTEVKDWFKPWHECRARECVGRLRDDKARREAEASAREAQVTIDNAKGRHDNFIASLRAAIKDQTKSATRAHEVVHREETIAAILEITGGAR